MVLQATHLSNYAAPTLEHPPAWASAGWAASNSLGTSRALYSISEQDQRAHREPSSFPQGQQALTYH
jgi:hypothetical protein